MVAAVSNGPPKDREVEVTQYLRRDVPICPDHGVMRAYMTRGRTTYYSCRCKDCSLTAKSIARVV